MTTYDNNGCKINFHLYHLTEAAYRIKKISYLEGKTIQKKTRQRYTRYQRARIELLYRSEQVVNIVEMTSDV